MYICFFVFVFLSLLGLVYLIAMFCDLALDTRKCPPVIISLMRCDMDIEYKVRSALAKNSGYVIVLLGEKCLANTELMSICSLLEKDNPRVRVCVKNKLDDTIDALK